MSSHSSLHKSVNSFSLLFAGAVVSFLAAPFVPTTVRLVEQSMAQFADPRSNTPEVTQQVDPSKIIFGLAVVGSGTAAIILSAKKSLHPSVSISKSQGSTIRLEQASPKLQKKFLRLLHNDLNAANRLLTQVKWKHPNQSVNWYVEKAIYDLQRDRGG